MSEVRTRDEAIASVDQALQVWSTSVRGVLAEAQHAALSARDEVEGAVRNYAREVATIEALLANADDKQRRQLQVRLVQAKDAHERAVRASARVSEVAARVSRLNRVQITAGTSQVASARAQLSAMSRALDGYRSGGTVLGGGGLDGGGSAAPAGGGSLVGMGLADLDVSSIDMDENPILDDDRSKGTFGKGGLSRADYRWAVQTWNDTVGPGVAAGKVREDFAERDVQSDAKPLRRTADVYDMFLGTDRIRVTRRPDGSLNIVNGRHRLLIATELGIKTLPAQLF